MRKLLCWFWLEHAPPNRQEAMGYYLGDGLVHFVGDDERQPSLLNLVTHWKPFDHDGLVEFEKNA